MSKRRLPLQRYFGLAVLGALLGTALVPLASSLGCVSPARDIDAEPPALGGEGLRIAAATGTTLRRYAVPETATAVDAPAGGDGLYIRGATTGRVVQETKYVVHGGRAGIITDVDLPHDGMLVEDVIVRDAKLWGLRRYGLRSCITRRVLVRNSQSEHGGYDAVWGDALYEDVTAINCAAQGWQLRLSGNRGDQHWVDVKTVTFTRFTALECGQLRGAGRASFALTVKDLGPNADVLIDDALIRTIAQRNVAKNSSGVWCNSFGGICVEFCRSLVIRGGYVEMQAPSAREAVQLFDYANKAPDKTGPQAIDIDGLVIAQGGCVAIRLGDADTIDIRNCVSLGGGGRIKLYARGADGVWRLSQSVPLEQGWVQ